MKIKMITLFLAVLLVFVPGLYSQSITRSPLEGQWLWTPPSGTINVEDHVPEFVSVVFFGNIIAVAEWDDTLYYEAGSFTYTGGRIKSEDLYVDWQYRISNNVLSITESGKTYTYTKNDQVRSPLEGIWKQSGGDGYEEGYEVYCHFTGDIMLLDGEGGPFLCANGYIYPAMYGYSIRGDSLTLIVEGEQYVFKKIY
jgi:hypothetical protein